jgi:hypothetical protein
MLDVTFTTLGLKETDRLATVAGVTIVALGVAATIGEALAGWLEWILDMRSNRRQAAWMSGVLILNCIVAAVPVLLVLRVLGIRFFESDEAGSP